MERNDSTAKGLWETAALCAATALGLVVFVKWRQGYELGELLSHPSLLWRGLIG